MSQTDNNSNELALSDKIKAFPQKIYIWILACLALVILFLAFDYLYIKAPSNFPTKTVISIDKNLGLNQIASTLKERKIIQSPFWFRVAVISTGGEKSLFAGDYFFENSLNVFDVASRLTHGNFGLTPVKVTFPEGVTVKQMSVILGNNLVLFDVDEFVRLATPKEGFNFPDTYLFLPNAKPEDVIQTMTENFNTKVKKIENKITSFGKPIKDVVIMASILEAEARTTETREIISGILWKRLNIGMPLQVDAPFQYIIGKNTYQLTTADLKYDSPYNTYLYRGLPPGAIGNPGLDSLTSAVNPKKTEYLYYLSDVRGGMHYAKTYQEHLVNKEKYLK